MRFLPTEWELYVRYLLVIGVVLVLVAALSVDSAFAKGKSYKVLDVDIEAQVQADGSLNISEHRTYKFRGRFKYAYRTFSLQGGIDYTGFQVREGGQSYRLDDSEDPGTYQVRHKDQEIEVRWFYRARNEELRFTIDYQVLNLIQRHNDAALLHYQFLGEEFKKSSEHVRIEVSPPEPIFAGQVQAWPHGPHWAHSNTHLDGTVTVTCEKLPRRRGLELRALYPQELFPNLTQRPTSIRNDVMDEEAAWGQVMNQKRENARIKAVIKAERLKTGSWAMPVLAGLAIIGWIVLFQIYGRRPEVPAQPDRSSSVPSDLPPAMVEYLIAERTVSSNALVGTLLDLARRGFLELHEETKTVSRLIGKDKTEPAHTWVLKREHFRNHRKELLSYEIQLIEFLFDELANADRVPIAIFKDNKSKIQKFFAQWKTTVSEAGSDQGFYDPESFRGRNWGMTLGGVIMAMSAGLAFLFYQWALVPGVVGLLLMLSSLAIVKHTPQGRLKARQWQALKRYLKKHDYRGQESGHVLRNVEKYLVYSAVLGLDKKVCTELGDVIPAHNHQSYIGWYAIHGGTGGFSGASFGGTFSTAVVSLNATMSQASGLGGGATTGVSSGAGGGGGGAG